MDIELARTFLAIVSAGSFIRAAERLHVSQTTVSARVRTLEDQLRRPLFIRSKAGASLTPAGEQFLRHAPALVQLWERARHQVAVPEGKRAVLAIGCELSLWDPLLLRWLLWMRRSAPDVALRAHVGVPELLVEQVAEGIVDIGVVYAPRYRAGLRVELLAEERLVMVRTPCAEGGDYVQVEWGPDVALQHAKAATCQGDPALVVDLGPLGLDYILAAGGAGYFRHGAVRSHLANGRLQRVAEAPEYPYPAYAVFSESGGPLIRDALSGLRQVARLEETDPAEIPQ
ncbi:LysR family transcriptional regulator [Siccirubricoccus deserti]|uniref:LysR family transcriptional regulator n=1 Tax=Siccirubricoccus deserti TaxID=2013562 RepID=A0A9X0UC97_9PROT|nr:LysR family transcriptional regulator [Siccirubricoccus deserti]MBC4014994.1 LysR family transcriptional regulator [Siccirubricoccus deserti]GGC36430.1 LysR family transcriptional regulator [Siccirubricoccus deserti]